MRHGDAERRLSEYLDGTLPRRDARRIEAHLAGCARCRNDLAELRRTSELLRGLRGGFEAPDLAAAVLERIRAGQAEPSVIERLRASASRLFVGAWGAPLATAAVGLAVLALVPRVEIEVSIPGGSEPELVEPLARTPAPHATAAPAPRTRRVNEGLRLSPEPSVRPPSTSLACLEQPSFEACQGQRELFMDLALRDTPAFLERVEEVPSTQRERWIGELSRFAAEAGSAGSVAERLRATGDPRARELATRFEAATFDGR